MKNKKLYKLLELAYEFGRQTEASFDRPIAEQRHGVVNDIVNIKTIPEDDVDEFVGLFINKKQLNYFNN